MTLGAEQNVRGPIWGELTRAQNRQAVSNLARAFHLPRTQAKTAVLVMLDALTQSLDEDALSRDTLARLIELLGNGDYERVLETPTLMGAPATQAIGKDALNVLFGNDVGENLASHVANAAGISITVAEYLMPVVAAMIIGGLSFLTRAEVIAFIRNEPAIPEDFTAALQLPVGRGSSGFFNGLTLASHTVYGDGERADLFRHLAEEIRLGANAAAADPYEPVRRIIARGFGMRARYVPWFAKLHVWGTSALQSAGTQAQQRLNQFRTRMRHEDR